jgi:decaprenyl-phosphate phosphoribosyltransferase
MANLQTEITAFKRDKTVSLFLAVIEAARPTQWLKNLAIFAALIFTGDLYDNLLFHKVFLAFIAFCFTTSATYLFNDIIDAKKDVQHPIKKNRPIPSGRLPIPLAFIFSTCFALVSLSVSIGLNELFFYTVLSYLVIQISYSLFLKNLAIIDILVIASGFIIRIYAGAFVINAHLSVWFLLCVISAALFLAAGKRRAELGVIVNTSGETRKSLTHYSKPLLDSFVTMFGNAAWLSWALFTFFESPRASLPIWLFLAEISKTTTINKLLMITIPVTIFAIMRYESLIFADRSEAPEKVLLSDKGLVVSVFVWIFLVIWVYYGGISVGFH